MTSWRSKLETNTSQSTMWWCFLAFVALARASDNKDIHYYPPGRSNPNVGARMYWRDAVGILRDLSSFDALYVRHESCV